MDKKIFFILFGLILLFGFLIRIIPPQDGNFYFTMDQGNDAVHVREIIERYKLPLLGPEAGIEGIFAGPLWFYFIALGYFIFGGNPFGSVFMLIILNLALTAVLMKILAKKVSPSFGLIAGGALQLFWPFYNTSRYGFNPFPLVFLSFLTIILLAEFLETKKIKYFLFAAIPVGLAFHVEVAFTAVLIILYSLFAAFCLLKHKLNFVGLMLGFLVLASFFSFNLIYDLKNGFPQTQAFIKMITDEAGVFSGTKFLSISKFHLELLGQSVFPQIPIFGFLFFSLLVFLPRGALAKWGQFTLQKNTWINNFAALTLSLVLISWLWFISNTGWQDWHTVAIPSLAFVSILPIIFTFPKKFAWPIFGIIVLSQTIFFVQNYLHFLKPSDDPSILRNELSAIDWVYQRANGQGFEAYSYLPSVYDYPYQYLYFWHGRKAYGYLPCQYSSYPDSPSLFVPGKSYYSEPAKACTNLRFLIIEPDKNQFVQDQWLNGTREGTSLVESLKAGQIAVEERVK